jgi:FtsP/CotA-like multicopper oxidase with cupredoxin domain
VDFPVADPDTTGQIMQFHVGPAVAADPSTPPQFLVLPALAPLPAESMTRKLGLIEMMSEFHEGPAEAMLGTVDAEGYPTHHMWMEEITENPIVGATEVWEMYNFTADAHPMHVHEVTFEVDWYNFEPMKKVKSPVQLLAIRDPRRPGRAAARIRSSPIPARSPASKQSSTTRAPSSGTAISWSTRTTR